MEAVAAEIIKALPGVLWVFLVGCLLLSFGGPLQRVIAAAVARIERGARFKVWQLEVETVASPETAAAPRQVGRVRVSEDPTRQAELERAYERTRYAMLVHSARPSPEGGATHEVVFYLVGHYNDLSHVQRVEYFLGKWWSNAVFTSGDRARGFAIKVVTYGSLLCIARLHFVDGGSADASRFVDLA